MTQRRGNIMNQASQRPQKLQGSQKQQTSPPPSPSEFHASSTAGERSEVVCAPPRVSGRHLTSEQDAPATSPGQEKLRNADLMDSNLDAGHVGSSKMKSAPVRDPQQMKRVDNDALLPRHAGTGVTKLGEISQP